jgi:anti-anti-sigma regulatory factor
VLKITTHTSDVSTRITLEGRLAGPWVVELETCWRPIAANPKSRAVVVDLTGVTFVDTNGKTLLAKMWRQGAELRAAGCLTKCIVEEITKTDPRGSSRSKA